jgi:hypothetical protein
VGEALIGGGQGKSIAHIAWKQHHRQIGKLGMIGGGSHY